MATEVVWTYLEEIPVLLGKLVCIKLELTPGYGNIVVVE